MFADFVGCSNRPQAFSRPGNRPQETPSQSLTAYHLQIVSHFIRHRTFGVR